MLTDDDKHKLRTHLTLSIRLVAKAVRMDRRRCKQWLQKHGALDDEGKTNRELLKRAFPDIFTMLEDEIYDSGEDNFSDLLSTGQVFRKPGAI